MTSRRAVLVVGLLITGCTASGVADRTPSPSTGAPSSTRSGPPSTGGATGTGLTGTGGTGTGTAGAPPSGLARVPSDTAIGDPATADLCAVIGLDSLRGIGAGLAPSFDVRQFPPSCSITVREGGSAVVQLSVYARYGSTAPDRAGRTIRDDGGQQVYAYPFDKTTGSCERDIIARGVRLVVDAYPPGSDVPDESVACGGTDAMAQRLAAAVTAGRVPRLSLADESISALRGCAIARHAGVASLPPFVRSRLIVRGFGVNCELKAGAVFLFLDFAIADGRQPRGSTQITIEGHRLYQAVSRPSFCSYASTQGVTADGRYEQVTATATVTGSNEPPTQLCAQTAQALARYLGAAGLS